MLVLRASWRGDAARGVGNTSRIRARDGWLAIGAVTSFVLISVAIRPFHTRPTQHTEDYGQPKLAPAPSGRPPKDVGGSPPTWHLHLQLGWLFRLLLDLLMVVGVLGLILLVILIVPRLQRTRRRAVRRDSADTASPDVDEPELAEQVSSTFDAALARLLRGEREAAIIACWLRLERLVEAAGVPRAESETSTELVRRLSGVLSLSEQPLGELAALYREARFSSHRMSEQALTAATQALGQLRAEVDRALPGIGHV